MSCEVGASGHHNGSWKGDAATNKAKNARARKLYSIDGKICEEPSCDKAAEHRHHRNGDPGDQRPENIGFYCARHHLLLHHPPQPPKPCVNCGRDAKPRRHGRCKACAGYIKRTGQERPWKKDGRREGASVYHPRPLKEPMPCNECGEPTKPLRRGLCRKCYDRQRWAAIEAAKKGVKTYAPIDFAKDVRGR